jgi:hypothetical protein
LVKLRCYSFGCGFFGCRDVAATFLLRQHGFGWLYAVSDINRSRGSGPVILPLEGVIDLASAIHAPVLSARRAAAESPTVFGFAVRRHFVAAATTSTEKTVDQRTGHLVGDDVKTRYQPRHSEQSVFKTLKSRQLLGHGCAACHVGNRDAAVFSHHER